MVIKHYLKGFSNLKVICFSCGNASRELREAGLDVLDVSPSGHLLANKWFTSRDFLKYFGEYFNATSGYLPFDLMYDIGQAFRVYLGELPEINYVACGSGETLVCLKLAYPDKNFIAVYDNSNPATVLDEESPLYNLVKLLASDIIIENP